jgi:predicted transcriptional regulator YdeE
MKNYTLVQKPSLLLVGIECRTSNAPHAGPQDIPQLWERFYSEGIEDKIPHKTSNEVFGLYCDYESDDSGSYSLVIGCPVKSLEGIPKGMVSKTVPAGSYAVFRAVGEHPQSLIETWGTIWKQKDLKRTFTYDYEVYGERFFSGSPKEVEVCIAL